MSVQLEGVVKAMKSSEAEAAQVVPATVEKAPPAPSPDVEAAPEPTLTAPQEGLVKAVLADISSQNIEAKGHADRAEAAANQGKKDILDLQDVMFFTVTKYRDEVAEDGTKTRVKVQVETNVAELARTTYADVSNLGTAVRKVTAASEENAKGSDVAHKLDARLERSPTWGQYFKGGTEGDRLVGRRQAAVRIVDVPPILGGAAVGAGTMAIIGYAVDGPKAVLAGIGAVAGAVLAWVPSRAIL